MSALTIKIPEPIMLPATTIVASNKPRVGLKAALVLSIKKSRPYI
jgi:hypothetical protein